MKAHEIEWTRRTSRDVSPIQYNESILDSLKNKHSLKFLEFNINDSTEWNGRTTSINLKCTIHGLINMKISSILRGSGCKQCGVNSMKEKTRKTHIQFVSEIIKIHGELLDLTNTNYINDHTKVEVRCIKHDYKFYSTPTHLLSGRSCKLCKTDKLSNLFVSNSEEFIFKSKLLHGDKFSYDKVLYIKSNIKVEIYCNNHTGYFMITPNKLLQGGCCQTCSTHGYNKNKPGYFYIQILYENDVKLYVKFGITNRTPIQRMKQQQGSSIFKHELKESVMFEDGSIPVRIENEIKKKLNCGIVNKHQLGDGYTETVSIKYIDSILSILENYKG